MHWRQWRIGRVIVRVYQLGAPPGVVRIVYARTGLELQAGRRILKVEW